MLYDTAVIGDCVQDIFILAKSRLIKECGRKNKEEKYLSFLYGDKINIDELHYDLGGSACNAAVAMKNLRIKTTMVSMLGGDIYSRVLAEQLKKKKVGRSFLIKEKNKNLGLSFILLGPDRDRTILTYRSSNDFNKIKIKRLLFLSRSIYMAGINQYSKVLQNEIIKHIKKSGKEFYINPSGYQIEKDLNALKKLLRLSTIACCNVEEAKAILKIKITIGPKDLLKEFKKITGGVAVITDGLKGSYATDGKSFFKAGIYPSKRIDTTGAGDSFFSTFVAAQKKGYDIKESLVFATVNSASVVSMYGAQRGLLEWEELVKRMRKNKVKIYKI